jgi:hypothetical protein
LIYGKFTEHNISFFGIKRKPRKNWAKEFEKMHKNGDDELMMPDVFEDEIFEDFLLNEKKYNLIVFIDLY